jgi:glycosyltransferase involved in cell wall biosynthesis
MDKIMSDIKKPPPRISVIIPAYNEGNDIGKIIPKIQEIINTLDQHHEIIVIDDGSKDETAKHAQFAGARVIQHPYNIGNGAAVKTGIRHARGNILVMMDGDGQHSPDDILRLVNRIGAYDMIVGSRNRESDTTAHRDIANMIFNTLATYVAGQKIEDLTSGFRAIKAPIARQFLYLLPNKFSYPSTITLSVVRAGYSLGYESIRFAGRSKNSKSKIKPLQDGLRFLMIILKIAVFYAPLKIFAPLSLFILLLGIGYGLFRIFIIQAPYGQTSALLISTAVLTFLVGLVSEQIAQLRFDRSEPNSPIDENE